MSGNNSAHFRILEDIARDLSGDVNFPTCLDAAILVRNTLKDPFANLAQVVQAIGVEPLISSKLLRLANSVSHNPFGERISDLGTAIGRLVFDIVRTTSLAVAMDQMLKSKNLVAYDRIARESWEHSVQVAAIARVLARHLGRVKPDEAMMAGLVHNIGAMIELLSGWHEGIGESLLYILGVPTSITEAVRDQSLLRNVETPCTVSDILYFAILLAGNDLAWQANSITEDEAVAHEANLARYADILIEAEEDIADLRAALAA